MVQARIDQVYALAVGPDDAPIYFYCGIALDPMARWHQHRRAIDRGEDTKRAYEWVRYHKQRHTLRMDILDPEGWQTERWWQRSLILEGHPLQNVGETVSRKRKPREWTPIQEAFNKVNKSQPLKKMSVAIRERMELRHLAWRATNGIDTAKM